MLSVCYPRSYVSIKPIYIASFKYATHTSMHACRVLCSQLCFYSTYISREHVYIDSPSRILRPKIVKIAANKFKNCGQKA